MPINFSLFYNGLEYKPWGKVKNLSLFPDP